MEAYFILFRCLKMTETEQPRRRERKNASSQAQDGEREDVSASAIEREGSPSLFLLPTKIASLAWKVVPFESLPVWLRDNEFLRNNHRPPMYSFRGCIKSMFRVHTETMNIWTHLLGFFFFALVTLSIYCFQDYFAQLFQEGVTISSLPWQEQVALNCFFAGAMICLLFSTFFHLFSNHSEKVYYVFSRLDYSGIAILIMGSCVPAFYYSFYCKLISLIVHISLITILGFSCVTVSLWKQFSLPKYRYLRFAVFVLFGLYGVVPTLQVWLQDGITSDTYPSLVGLIVMALIYMAGAFAYVLRIPERFGPGRFDVLASSHQWFHLCVVAAAVVHYDTLLGMVKTRLDLGSCGVPIDLLIAS